jgi:hypothetical protein
MMASNNETDAAKMFPGLQVQENERVLLSGYARKRLSNPLMPDTKHREGFVLTDQRLIMFSRPRSGNITGAHVANLTSMPLREIDCVQALDIRWSLLGVLSFFLLCLLYVIPGVIYLFYMFSRTGLWLVAHAGSATNEVKYSRRHTADLAEAIRLIQKCRSSDELVL